ncbi:TonB-dependent receptor [Sphingobium mellinum]|uniref:TonB-dependent receptor n=1 Tax=Sphingobium mellinum TaxID=1387166 RepID=UPI0030EEA472
MQQQDGAVVNSGDIIVTARKREERLQDVPVAISVLTGEDISRYGTQSMNQLAAQVPSLVAGVSSNTAAGGTISLRGIGSPATGLMVDQAVSLNIDGVQISKAFALRLGVFDIARTEVLKGPQALFFGKNSPGGIISLISADPGSKFEAMLRGGYEFAAHKKYVEGMVSAPLTDTLGLRVTGAFADSRGWFINTAEPLPALTIPAFLGGGSTPPQIGASNRHGPSAKDYFARATLNFDPSDAFDAKLKMSYSRSDQKDGPTIGNQLFACANGGPFYAELLNSPASRDCRINRYVDDADFPAGVTALSPMLRNGRPFVEDRQFLASLATNFHLSDQMTLSSVTGYYDLTNRYLSNFSFGGQAYLGGRYDLHDKQFTQELRLSSDLSSPFNFLVGAFYQDEKANANGLTFTDSLYTSLFTGFAVPPSPQILLAGDVSQKTTAWSVFGQAIVDVTDKVQLTAGGRYSREKKRAAAGVDPNISAPTAYDVILAPSERTFENFSPEITLTYKPAPNATIYGSYRHGFKSGGFDLRA